jgi:predicted TIM-barrel enzyme
MGWRFFRREEILERLNNNVKRGIPIIGAGSSCGLVAKCAERGGADLLIVYSTGLSRLKGLPTTVIGDSNGITLEMADEILNVVDDTPVVAGFEAQDPRIWDNQRLIQKFVDKGYSGLINFPTLGWLEPDSLRRKMREPKQGVTREMEIIRTARSMNIFTMAYAFRPGEAKGFASAGVDLLVAHVGGTEGGMTGFEAASREEAASVVQKMIDAAREANPQLLCVAHGGPFATPEDTEYLYRQTHSQGFIGASSVERIPVEKAVKETVQKYKSYRIKIGPGGKD